MTNATDDTTGICQRCKTVAPLVLLRAMTRDLLVCQPCYDTYYTQDEDFGGHDMTENS